MKEFRYVEGVRMLRDGKWEPATVLEKSDEPASYILKTENRRMYRWSRSHILKTQADEDHMTETSNDDEEEETSEENVTVQSDEIFEDMKQEESSK